MIAYSHARRCSQIAALAAGLTFTGPSQAQQSQDKPPAAPRGEKPAPNVQAAPTAVPGRPDIPNAEIASKLCGVPAPPFPAPADKLALGN